MHQSSDRLKRKLRQLKKLELAIRFPNQPPAENYRLVWDVFFSTKPEATGVKYPFDQLLGLEPEQLERIFEEYFYRVFFENYKENGLALADVYDPKLLSLLGLPPYAGLDEIKHRFRELAKRYHPDLGGDSAKFIELMKIYEELQGEHE